ncbi:MAG: hypothetical protein IJP82_05625 [Bacteroidaceae bacterium]|nr:hypothetical protein [Bacteroidaceae bacterium]
MKKMYLAIVLLTSLVLGACSSDDDNDSKNAGYTETSLSEAPVWQIDWNNNQERPDWSEPDGSIYENWTILKVQIEEELQPFVSEKDMMALFINDELRGLATPAVIVGSDQSSNTTFLIKAYGNETETERVNISLTYYNETLKHIFTLSDSITLDSDESIGIDEDYIPEFTYGSSKYPAMKTVGVENILTKVGLTPTEGNTMGAFVGEECRGTVTLSASGSTTLVIYGRNDGESVTLKYYDATTGILYTITDAVEI